MAKKCGCSANNLIMRQLAFLICIKAKTDGNSHMLWCNSPTTHFTPISFEYKTPRIRLTPKDLRGTNLANPKVLHFICSPARALDIMSEVDDDWSPITIYEPVPVSHSYASLNLCRLERVIISDGCIPEELPALEKVLPLISVLRLMA